jgi:diguanylate cyclase
MTPQAIHPPGPAPDRQFVRVTGILLAVALGITLLSHLAMERALHWERSAAEIALASASEAAAARTVINTADRLAILPEGNEARRTRSRLAWDIEQLASAEERRLSLIETPAGLTDPLSGEINAVIDVGLEIARNDAIPPPRAELLSGRVSNEILPQIDVIAIRDRARADFSRTRCLWALGASLVLQITTGLALVVLLVRPTRRKIEVWVARSYETERENRFRLLHDPLTGMPNSAYLHAYLTRLAAGSDRRATQTSVMRIDFDRFKSLRKTLGTRLADELIRIASRRIQQALRSNDFAAYTGQDDFVVVATELPDANAAAAIASRIQNALSKPFSAGGAPRRLSCSIGVTLMSDDEADPDLILANAAIALAEAQTEGPGLIRYFNAEQREEVRRRETLYAELVRGLDTGEIIAFFQPQIEIGNSALAGFEALVRWRHPERGLLTPAAFLEFAEQADLTERLGEIVLSRALEALTAWDAQGLYVPKVGVNFALAQLRNPRLIEKIKWETERFDVQPERLAIEVLETVLIKSDADLVVRNLHGLASNGFIIELDDFGTGHASISNLRRFMVNRIKIDRSFVLGIETSVEQQQLTASMIAMANALNIETLAEGIETEDAQRMLARLGCKFGQGYKIAKPMSLAETFTWLKTHCAAFPSEKDADGTALLDPNMP